MRYYPFYSHYSHSLHFSEGPLKSSLHNDDNWDKSEEQFPLLERYNKIFLFHVMFWICIRVAVQ